MKPDKREAVNKAERRKETKSEPHSPRKRHMHGCVKRGEMDRKYVQNS